MLLHSNGRLLILTTYIRLGRTQWNITNAVVYYSINIQGISFIVQALPNCATTLGITTLTITTFSIMALTITLNKMLNLA